MTYIMNCKRAPVPFQSEPLETAFPGPIRKAWDVPNHTKITVQRNLLGPNINMCDALIIRLDISQVANVSLIIPSSAVIDVLGVPVEA